MTEQQQIIIAVFGHVVESGEVSLGRLLQLVASEFGPEGMPNKALSACDLLVKSGVLTADEMFQGDVVYSRNTFRLPSPLRESLANA